MGSILGDIETTIASADDDIDLIQAKLFIYAYLYHYAPCKILYLHGCINGWSGIQMHLELDYHLYKVLRDNLLIKPCTASNMIYAQTQTSTQSHFVDNLAVPIIMCKLSEKLISDYAEWYDEHTIDDIERLYTRLKTYMENFYDDPNKDVF